MIKNVITQLFVLATISLFAQESYYNDVNLNLTGTTLKDALATKIISTHTNSLDYSPDVWEACKATDVNPQNANEVLLIYGYSTTGNTSRTRDINNNGGNVGQWNREHTFSNSLANPHLDQTGDNGPPYSDAHNLRACDFQVNSTRGNKKFVSGSGNSGAVNTGWYPGDEWKGDAARIAMYMYLRYGDQCFPAYLGEGSTANTPDDMIDLFLQWNAEDPVSDYEIQRNVYHGNITNTYAQGNRNPFIDNPILATRIWGGPQAEDRWGIYTTGDTEAPSTPTNLSTSNVTTATLNLSWTASTDNVGVTSYEVYQNDQLLTSVTTNAATIENLTPNTQYTFKVRAKDLANNNSGFSNAVSVTTLVDNQPPTVPTNIVISNQTENSFIIKWDAATDNTIVTGYNVYLAGTKISSPTNTEYTATGLTASTTYSVQISAFDGENNESTLSTAVNATTTDGTASSANELFISEYIEGGGNNKAIEIANITNMPIDLTPYSLKRNANGGSDWSAGLDLSGTIPAGETYVVINGGATASDLINNADYVQPNNQGTNYGDPVNFNGNDPVGLFKNGVLIDIVGEFGNSANFAKDKTLVRKSTIISPNTTFNLANEWDEYPKDTYTNIGQHTVASASTNVFNKLSEVILYPNPTTSTISLSIPSDVEVDTVKVYSLIGKELLVKNNTNTIDVSNLNTGIYLIKISNETQSITKKLIVN